MSPVGALGLGNVLSRTHSPIFALVLSILPVDQGREPLRPVAPSRKAFYALLGLAGAEAASLHSQAIRTVPTSAAPSGQRFLKD